MAGIIDLSGAVLPRQITGADGTALLQNYLTITENPHDDAVITEHPVDVGAAMSDHIFLRPPEIVLRLGWSNADEAAGGDPSYVRNIYQSILQAKNARRLLAVWTGKRLYNNMFPAAIRGPETDHRYEWSIIVEIQFKQLLLVDLNAPAATTPNSAAPSSNQGNLASPETGTPVQKSGFAQATVASGPATIPDGSPGNPDVTGLQTSPAVSVMTNSNGGGSGPQPFLQQP